MKINPHAELLASWAFNEVLRPKPRQPYPLEGAKILEVVGSRKLELPQLTPSGPLSEPLSETETLLKIHALNDTLALAQDQAEEILERGSGSEMAPSLLFELCPFIKFAQSHIARVAEHDGGDVKAVETLAFCATHAANELCELGRKRKGLVRPVAEKMMSWPVNYIPHGDSQRELKEEIKSLGVGKRSAKRVHNMWSNRPADKQHFRHIGGKYANRIGHTLLRISDDPALFADVSSNPKTWPAWVVAIVKLPPIDSKTNAQWFEVGWALLEEAAGGSVTTLPELYPIGDRRAAEWEGQGASKAQIKGQREIAIKEALEKAFRARFGSSP